MAFDMVLDTETTDQHYRRTTEPCAEAMLCYDFGAVVRDTTTGEIVERVSYVVAETYYNTQLMQSAYYAKKRSIYNEGIRNNEWLVVPFATVYEWVRNVIKQYHIRTVWAYNAKFDTATLNNTVRYYSHDYVRFFFPYKTKIKDVWDRCTNITGTEKYVRWALDNGYVSPKGNPRTNAECVYRYLTGDDSFAEAHTALADAEIEAAILTIAQKKHKKSRQSIGQGWRDAAAIARALRAE